MKKRLSTAEVAQVDAWISKRGFTYEDVRIEILDHVVCAIETLWEEDPELPLQQAFKQVHASFGVFGFATMEETFIDSIEKRIRRQLFDQLAALFKPSGILLTLSLFLLLAVINHLGGEYLLFAVPILVTTYFITQRILVYKKQKSLRNHLAFRTALSYTYFTLPASFYSLVWLPKLEDTSWLPLFCFAFAGFLTLLEWAQWQVLQAELDKHRQLCQKIGLA